MPQINALNLANTPRSLADIANVRVSDMPSVWEWQRNSQQMDQTTLEDMMRAANEEATLSPGRVKRQEADLQSVLLGNQEKQQDITKKTMDNELAAHLLPQAKQTEWKKLLKEASDSDLKVAENEVYNMLRSPDPKIRAVGKQLESGLTEAVKQRLQGDQQMRVQSSQNAAAAARNAATIASAEKINQANIDAGKYNKKGSQAAANVADAVLSGKLGYEKGATMLQTLATLDPENPDAPKWLELANKFAQEALKKEAAKAGSPNLGAMGIETNPAPQTGLGAPAPAVANRPARQEAQQTNKTTQAKEDWISRAMKANPGMSREQVEEQGKKLGKF